MNARELHGSDPQSRLHIDNVREEPDFAWISELTRAPEWKAEPATAKQVVRLLLLGLDSPVPLTRGEAAEIVNRITAQRTENFWVAS